MYGLGAAGPIDPATGVAEAGTAPNFDAFRASPDYEFARQEALRATERSAAARGGLRSGTTLAALEDRAAGLASQNFGNYVNRLAGLAGTGQQSAENLAANRMNLGQQIGQNAIGAGNARASGIEGAADQWNNFAGGVGGTLGYYGRLRMRNQMVQPTGPGAIGPGAWESTQLPGFNEGGIQYGGGSIQTRVPGLRW